MIFTSVAARPLLRLVGAVVAMTGLPAQAVAVDAIDRIPGHAALAPGGVAAPAAPGSSPAGLELETDGPSPDGRASSAVARTVRRATRATRRPCEAVCPWRAAAELARAGRAAAPPTGPPSSTI